MAVAVEEDAVANAPSPPNKEVKTAPKSIEDEIKAHIARRKRAKQGVKMVMLRSEAVSQEWEKLSNAT